MDETHLARFIDHFTVEFVRIYPHPIERVWKAITDPAEVAVWFIPPMVWDMAPGGAYRFQEHFAGVIQAVEPPRFVIRFGQHPDLTAWPGADAYFQFDLEPVPGGTRLRFVQHASPSVSDPDELRTLFVAPGRPGSLAGWHDAFDELTELLDGVPIGTRLPVTRLTEIVRNWAGFGMAAEFTTEQKARILAGLRSRERWFDYVDLYTAHVAAIRPPRDGGSSR